MDEQKEMEETEQIKKSLLATVKSLPYNKQVELWNELKAEGLIK